MLSSLQFHGVLLLWLCTLSYCLPLPSEPSHRDRAHGYPRFADVQRQCQSVLSSAVQLRYAYSARFPERLPSFRQQLERELSFEKGEWRQDSGHVPLLPFDGGDATEGAPAPPPDPLRLATFVLTHVDVERAGRTAVNVSGVLVLSIARESAGDEIGPGTRVPAASPEFEILPGSTRLKVPFEGVYTETLEGGGGEDGERVLCMVGSTVLPARGTDGRTNLRPPVIADNNVVLVVRYPKELTLTTRAVHGEMRSTNAASDAAYFDTVRLMSNVGTYNMPYRFMSDELVAAACSPWPASDAAAVANHSGELYSGVSICEVLNRYATAVTNWQCGSKHQPCRWPGHGEASGFDVDAIALQDVQCRPSSDVDGSEYSARVSAVFRVLSPREHRLTAVKRTNLDGTTLAAEGVWKASTGQACMVGCLAGSKNACRYRVCLYIPTTFSVTRRSIMLARITSIDAGGGGGGEEEGTRPPLLLEQRVPSVRLWGLSDVFPFRMAYNYTMVKRAGELLRRSGAAFSARDIVARSLGLSYPKNGTTAGDDEVTSLFRLGDELMLRFTALLDLFPSEWIENPVLLLEMLSVEQAVGPITPKLFWHGSSMAASQPGEDKEPAGTGRRLLLNVSAELRIVDPLGRWMSAMSLEGVYNPEDGRMFLIGCRDVRPLPGRNMSTSRDLEKGNTDCSVEVKVEYPPTTTHWLIGSTAKVHITSTRRAGDPLRFAAVRLEVLPVMYQKRWWEVRSAGVINGVLCAVVLSVAIAAALGQLRHLESHADVAPYVSQAMLAIQIAGYGLPLITGVEALLEKTTFGSQAAAANPPLSSATSYALAAGTGDDPYRAAAIDQAARALLLAALLLTLGIGHKVRRSRACSPPPADRTVLAYSCGAPLAALALAVALNGVAVSAGQLVALMHDLFLLPQVIGNAVRRVSCKPLAESYYLGVTAARVLPHAYGYARPPAVHPYSDEYLRMPKPVDLVVPLVAVVLALVVYVQQRWNYTIVSRVRQADEKKSQHIF